MSTHIEVLGHLGVPNVIATIRREVVMVVGPIGLADYAHRISLCLSALLNYLPATLGISCERSPTVSVPTVYGHSWGMSRWRIDS